MYNSTYASCFKLHVSSVFSTKTHVFCWFRWGEQKPKPPPVGCQSIFTVLLPSISGCDWWGMLTTTSHTGKPLSYRERSAIYGIFGCFFFSPKFVIKKKHESLQVWRFGSSYKMGCKKGKIYTHLANGP